MTYASASPNALGADYIRAPGVLHSLHDCATADCCTRTLLARVWLGCGLRGLLAQAQEASLLQEHVEGLSWELRWQAAPGLAQLLPPEALQGILVNPQGATEGLPSLTALGSCSVSCGLLQLQLSAPPGNQLADLTCSNLQVQRSLLSAFCCAEIAGAPRAGSRLL